MNPIQSTETIDYVFSGCNVDFDLLTTEHFIYVAYYNQNRQMTLAKRSMTQNHWEIHPLPSESPEPPAYNSPHTSTFLGWDSHNYVTLAIDRQGFIHVSGNMHCNRLTYFRSEKPHDIQSIKQIPTMIGNQEDQVTYPRFKKLPTGALIFHYRYGESGNGNELFNIYNEETQSWSRFFNTHFTDGKGERNAYMIGPIAGPDGYFHISYGWRETPDAASCHDLCYARSLNLKDWQTITGNPIQLPLTLKTPGVLVDPVSMNKGFLNHAYIGFDSSNHVILSYQKYDEQRFNQIWNARWETDHWHLYRMTDWKHRWEVQGYGSLDLPLFVHPVEYRNGCLMQRTQHLHYGNTVWKIDEPSMRYTEPMEHWRDTLDTLRYLSGRAQVNWKSDSSITQYGGAKYFLRWETLPHNHDSPYPEETLPDPTPLELLY